MISTPQLNPLPDLHLEPINPIVSRDYKRSYLRDGFALICFQRLSKPNDSYPAMPLVEQLVH